MNQHATPDPSGPEEGAGWTLSIGIHNGTLTSRDTADPQKLSSLEACQTAVTEAERRYANLGYFIWFADATSPSGEKHRMNYKYVPYS